MNLFKVDAKGVRMRSLAWGVLAVVVGVAAGYGFRAYTAHAADARLKSSATAMLTRDSVKVDSVIVLAWIVQSTCGVCKSDEFITLARRVTRSVRQRGDSTGLRVHVHGIAADLDVGSGERYLKRLLEFDEISAGRGWLNSGAYAAFWESTRSVAAVPSLLLVRQLVQSSAAGMLVLQSDTVARASGLDDMRLMSEKVAKAEWFAAPKDEHFHGRAFDQNRGVSP